MSGLSPGFNVSDSIYTPNAHISTATKASDRLESNRRATCDPMTKDLPEQSINISFLSEESLLSKKEIHFDHNGKDDVDELKYKDNFKGEENSENYSDNLNIFSAANPQDNRRTTVDATDMEVLMRDLDESDVGEEIDNTADFRVFDNYQSKEIEERNEDQSTENLSKGHLLTISPFKKTDVTDDIPSPQNTSHGSSRLSYSSASNFLENGDEDCDKSFLSSGSRIERRLTADPIDIAAMALELEEEHRNKIDLDFSEFDENEGLGKQGRDSMCTVDLVQSVAEMLRDMEEGAKSSQTPDTRADISTVSFFSVKSNSSCKTKSTKNSRQKGFHKSFKGIEGGGKG